MKTPRGLALSLALALCLATTPSGADVFRSGTVLISIPTVEPAVLEMVPDPPETTSVARDLGGRITSLGMPEALFAVSELIVPVTDPGVFPIAGIQATASNAGGTFARNGNLGGVLPLQGSTKVCLYGACGTAANVSNLQVPLGVFGNAPPDNVATVVGAVSLTVVGAPWTTGTAAVGSFTQMGASADPVMSGDELINGVTLVTPVLISTNIGAFPVVPAISSMHLEVVASPEPGVLAAFASSIGALVAMGVSRRRARASRARS
jgi:hypothetical protein